MLSNQMKGVAISLDAELLDRTSRKRKRKDTSELEHTEKNSKSSENVLSTEEVIKSSARVLLLYGPHASDLAPDTTDENGSATFPANADLFLRRELLCRAGTWAELEKDGKSSQLFCKCLDEELSQLQQEEDYEIYRSYAEKLKDRLSGSPHRVGSKQTELIITNDIEDLDSQRKLIYSQKSLPKLRPPGASLTLADHEEEDDEVTQNVQAVKVAGRPMDGSMVQAITSTIQRRLNSAFYLPPMKFYGLTDLPVKPWTCPQEMCTMTIPNANSTEGRECISQHYKAHAKQYLGAVEAVAELAGASAESRPGMAGNMHVERLLERIDNMVEVWKQEENNLTEGLKT
ncbi:uncharacterized protein V1516DRAFT_428362 [Lipomyces oligophaga]|uniref:uncharacterized protein n=1 Tax=Lipomyces oligophaga TaxID=45792 RepID=UPI0034CDE7EF